MKNTILLLLSFLFAGSIVAGDSRGVVRVRLGKTIERTYKDVQRDKFAYGPKQEYDRKRRQTHVYLPYGDNRDLYYEVKGILTDPDLEKGVAKFKCEGANNAVLTYKIEFDRAITSFQFSHRRFEYGLTRGTAAGIEYSTDGKRWTTIKEVRGTAAGPNKAAVNDFVNKHEVKGLNTKVLYIRYYTRSIDDAGSGAGPGRWLQLWLAGSPKWGDVRRTFFIHHPQLWVRAK